MNSTQPSKRCQVRLGALGLVILASFAWAPIFSASTSHEPEKQKVSEQTLTAKQQAIAPIGASMAVGDMPRLHDALNRGLDAGLTISESKEILVQLYAYAGFPRSLNALSLLMKVLQERAARGIHDAPGRDPGPVPSGRALLDLSTDNQTRELATVGAIAAIPGLEPQLESHLKISMNVGLTVQQLRQVASELKTAGEPDGSERILVALEKISG